YTDYYGGDGRSDPVVLSRTGTYYVAVSSAYGDTSEYDLRVSLADPALQVGTKFNNGTDSANPVRLTLNQPGHIGATVAGAVTYRDDGDFYQLGNLTANTVVTLTLPAQPSTSPLSPILAIYAGGLKVAVSNPGDTTLTYTIPTGGDGPYFA